MDREINRAKRDNTTLAFFMLDIDHFKLYNDTYGHVSGDIVLQKVATVFTSMFQRGADFCFRMGGEEFSILIEIKDKDEASIIATMILEEINNLKIIHEHNSASEYVSLSIGIHVINPDSESLTPQEIYKSADEKLYIAKEEGRYRFVI
jgi:diguanylate cyclase (GGDEF)-like protein